MKFEYFYGEQSDMYAFYRIPKILITSDYFTELSTNAKLLYGLLLDRVSLSSTNGWFDEQGRVYIIYTIGSIQRDMHCGDKKATRLLAELEKWELIEKKHQGQGKPSIIYVKNFLLPSKQRFQDCQNNDSRPVKTTIPGTSEQRCNNTNSNYTDFNNTNPILSEDEERMGYEKYLLEQLDISDLKQEYPYDSEIIDGIVDLILDVLCSKRKSIRIAGDEKSANVVRSRFMKLNVEHIRYVMKCLQENTTKIRSIKQYMLAALYNAPVTIDSYYRAEVSHDMATGKI